jgi:hypothetical protein
LASWLELHLVHEILDTHFVQNAIRIDEEQKQIIVPAQILGVNLVDEFERFLLARSLSSMPKARDRDSAAAIGDVDALWVRLQSDWHTKLFDSVEIQLILLISIEG